MKDLKHLSPEEVEQADSIMLEGSEIDEDDLGELLNLYYAGGVIFKYTIGKEEGKVIIRIW